MTDFSIAYSHRPVSRLASVQIIENSMLTVTVEDWSGVRSPSRARRRMKRGFRQNVVHRIEPDPKVYMLPNRDMVCHPTTLKVISAGIDKQIRDERDRQYLNALYGRPM